MKYRAEVDGLRAVAILPVIFFHAGFKAFEGGFVGVDVFFVVSGYLITTIILSDMNNNKFSIVTFYERRARRIMPALFFVMVCCLPFAWMWLLPQHLRDFCQSLTAVSLFSSNILFWQESGYFGVASELKPLLHTWSLAVEEQYYVLFPLFLMLLWRLRKRWIFGALMVVGALSLALAQWGAYNKPAATFFLLPTRGWELAIGALIAFYFLYQREHADLIKQYKKTSEVFGVVGLLMIIYSVFAFNNATPFPSFYALIPTVGTGLVIIFATSETAVGRLLSTKFMVGVGLISYSTYLWHQPLFVFARHRSLEEPSTALLLVLSVASLLLAYISWRYVEGPFRNKKLISRKAVFTFTVAGSVIFAGVGVAGHYSADSIWSKRISPLALENLLLIEDGPEYTNFNFTKLVEKKFDLSDLKPKVLIIGDSYAKDLTNAIYEAGYDNYLQLSTYRLPKQCGNLFIQQEILQSKITDKYSSKCKSIAIFENDKLHNRMKQADEVWFASSWYMWQAQLMDQSIKNLIENFGEKIKIFGRKNFGKANKSYFIDLPDDEKKVYVRSLANDEIIVNRYMKENLTRGYFVDVQSFLCGSEIDKCNVTTEDGYLKTYDSTHLTSYGAKIYGKKLVESGILSSIVE